MSASSYAYPPITRGDDAEIALEFVQQDLFTLEVSRIDLTGAAVELVLNDGTTALGGTSDNGLTIDRKLSSATHKLSPAQTRAIRSDELLGRWRITYPSGRVETVLYVVIPVQD